MRFGIESGEDNRTNYLEHSGALFYYGRDEARLQRTAALRVGDDASERENGFTCADGTPVTLTSYFEGDDDEAPVDADRPLSAGRLRLPGGRAYGDGRRHPPPVSDQEKGRAQGGGVRRRGAGDGIPLVCR